MFVSTPQIVGLHKKKEEQEVTSIPRLKYNYILCVNTKLMKIVKIIRVVDAY